MNMLRQKLSDIFRKVQIGSSQIHLKRLQIIYQESDFEEFLRVFLTFVNKLIKLKNDNDFYIDKVLVFISKFCTSLRKVTDDTEQICPFLKEIFLHLFKDFNDEVISTYRVCQLIKLLLKEIGEQESFLDEDICIQIRDLMLVRIDDLKARVRVQAIEVLQRLQDPLDNNDVIVKAFIDRFNDDNTQVRKHIVQCIGLNIISIPAIVGRCLDVSDEVRFVCYDKISKIPIKALKIAQRQFVLRNGFADKCAKNHKFILKTLLPQWLSTYNGNYFELICALKLDADEKDFKQTTTLVENVLRELFKNTEISTIMEALPLGKEKLITSSEVQWEEIVFWRCLEQFLHDQENETDYVDKILPELIFFCDFVVNVNNSKSKLKSEWDIVQHDHIMFELLKICHDYDHSDEVGRNALLNLITAILIDGPALYDVTKLLVKMLEKLIVDIEERTSKFCEIIGEIQTPMTPIAPSEDMIRRKNVKLAELRCKLNIAEDKQETAIEKEDYDKAANLKKEIAAIKEKIAALSKEFDDANVQRVPKTDTTTLCRCLDILTASLQNSQIRSLPETYRAFQDIFLPPLLNSNQPDVYWRAMRQLCLFSLYDAKLAKESMKVFFNPLLAHTFRPVFGDQTTIAAITCITDVILIHGSAVFDEEDNSSGLSQRPTNKRKILDKTTIDETICNEPPTPSLELVIESLSELLDDTDDKIKETSGECLVTLILTGRVRSSLLFSKLLLKWFSPNTSKDVRLRQMIGQLVVDYVHENPYSLEVVEQAFIPTLQAIIDAPRNSPLADVEVDSVSKFLAALCQQSGHKYNVGLDPHKNIALLLCKEICDRPQNRRTLYYLKALLYLDVPRDDEATLDILRKQVDVMQEIIKDKASLRCVFKYRHKLDNDLTHNENTATVTSLTSAVPESTINSTNVNVESNNTVDSQRNEESRYSSLSVKRRKRPSKDNAEVMNGGTHINNVIVRINRDLELEKVCSRMVISETDSEYSTEPEIQGHKKKHCSKTQQQISEPLAQNQENSSECSSATETDSVCSEQQKDLPCNITNKRLAVRLVRNKKIDKMCRERDELHTKHIEKKSRKEVPDNILNISLERNEEIEIRVSKNSDSATSSPKTPPKRKAGRPRKTEDETTTNKQQSIETIIPEKRKAGRPRKTEDETTTKKQQNTETISEVENTDRPRINVVEPILDPTTEMAIPEKSKKNIPDKMLNVTVERNEEIERRLSKSSESTTSSPNTISSPKTPPKKSKKKVPDKMLNITVERNEEIERRLSKSSESTTSSSKTPPKKSKKKVPDKMLNVTVERNEEIERRLSKSSESTTNSPNTISSPKTPPKRKAGRPRKNDDGTIERNEEIERRVSKDSESTTSSPKTPKRKPGRQRKTEDETFTKRQENTETIIPEVENTGRPRRNSVEPLVDKTTQMNIPENIRGRSRRIQELVEKNTETIGSYLRNRSKSRNNMHQNTKILTSKLRNRTRARPRQSMGLVIEANTRKSKRLYN